MTSKELEEHVSTLLLKMGFSNVRRVGGSGDRGVDIVGDRSIDRFGSVLHYAVQCKCYTPDIKIGSREVRIFYSDLRDLHGADRGIFMTTSSFTEEAQEVAKRLKITLVDGNELQRLGAEYGLISETQEHARTEADVHKEGQHSGVALGMMRLEALTSKAYRYCSHCGTVNLGAQPFFCMKCGQRIQD